MSRKRYLVYIGIFLLVTFNYIDRVALSVAGPPLAKEFGLSPVQLGYLFSSFMWLYLPMLIPWGILSDRFGERRINSIAVTLWSAATVATGFMWSFASILVTRLVMGGAESSSFPAGGRTLRQWAPRSEYGLTATMLNSGSYSGPAVGMLLISWVVSVSNWRVGFVVAGLICLIWLVGWLVWYRRPEEATFLDEEERQFILRERDAERPAQVGGGGFQVLLRSRSMWAVALAQGCAVYTQLLFLTWLPSYLATEKHLDIMHTGLFTALPYVVTVFASWGLAHLSDKALRGTDTSSGKRRWMVCVAMLSASVVLLAPLVDSVFLILLLITLSLTGICTGLSLNIALGTDLLQSPADSGKAMGMQITGGNVFGLIAPITTGYIIAYTGSYNWAFIAGGILLLVGAAVTMTLTYSPIGAPPDPRAAIPPSKPLHA
jgi:ACS family glucarate transporter-like MFS transporter